MVVGKRQTAWPASTVSRASASGWQWRRRAQECAAGFSAGAHLSCRRGIKDLHTAGERAEAGRRCIGPRHPGARNGKRFVQGKAGPIVFRVGMFGYVRLPYVRYFCWSLARPQMLPDRGLPLFVGRLLSTPGPRFCVAKSGAGLRVGFPLYMTPRARSDTRFLRYALTD